MNYMMINYIFTSGSSVFDMQKCVSLKLYLLFKRFHTTYSIQTILKWREVMIRKYHARTHTHTQDI